MLQTSVSHRRSFHLLLEVELREPPYKATVVSSSSVTDVDEGGVVRVEVPCAWPFVGGCDASVWSAVVT